MVHGSLSSHVAHDVHIVAPPSENVPIAQAMHDVPPAIEPNVPGAHAVQIAAPGEPENVPIAHGAQLAKPASSA